MGLALNYLAAILAASAAPPADQLRAASPLNIIPKTATSVSAGQDGWTAEMDHVIGSGDRKSLAMVVNNWALAASGGNAVTLPGNTVTITGAWIAYNGVLVQCLFSGATSKVMADGDADVVTDEVFPAAFGATTFPLGATVKCMMAGTIGTAGGKLPTWVRQQDRYGNIIGKSFVVANTTPTAAVGGFSFAGTAPSGMSRVFPIILVGKYINGDPITPLGIGDSIWDGDFDQNYAGTTIPRGYFMRALWGAGGTDALAGINCGLSGGKNDPWYAGTNGAKPKSMVKYCNVAIDEYGTNLFPTAGAANSFPTGETSMRGTFTSVWSGLRSNAYSGANARTFKVAKTILMPRVSSGSVTGSSPDITALAVASQSPYGPQWDAGGDCQKLQDWWRTQLGSTVDAIFDPGQYTRASTDSAQADFYKWQAGLNTDATHPGYLLAPTIATAFRTFLLSL